MTTDILEISQEVITHTLNLDPGYEPIWQKKRRSFILEQQKAINEEAGKLLDVKFIREAHYPDWLANAVIIKQANKKK